MATPIRPDLTRARSTEPLAAPPDGCPECVTGRHYPNMSTLTGDGGIRGYYCCAFCGHRWVCNWSIEHIG